MINDLWYKNAVIYCLSVGTYMDSNGDGTGDFRGLMRRLDYLHGLGVTAIWLMPFQTSPCRDDGYDVADYYNVDPRRARAEVTEHGQVDRLSAAEITFDAMLRL
jgi:maltose alpha-D-glucosyltransferase/alpha-amylase